MLSLEIICKQSVFTLRRCVFLREGPLLSAASRSLWRPNAHSRGVPINVSLPLGGKRPHSSDSDQARKPADRHLLVKCLGSRGLFKEG